MKSGHQQKWRRARMRVLLSLSDPAHAALTSGRPSLTKQEMMRKPFAL
jgi:hypothetical protein